METKEYIVSLNRGVNYDEFWNQIENVSESDGFVPERRVDIVDNRDLSLRQCHYALTDEEAVLLRNDPRVYAVEEPTKIPPRKFARQAGNFTKTTGSTGTNVNWGMRRCIETTNVYGTSTTVTGDYLYGLDGTGVDVVIQDSGIQPDHPEFTDANGVSRVQLINWFTASGVTGTQSNNHYRDTDGHGTHVAGTAVGKTYGWAKNARIYSVKVRGLEGGGDSNTGITVPACFDVIRGWHLNKPINPVTGFRRPTIVNMSWGYTEYFDNINGGVYRGTPWSGTTRRTEFGMVGVQIDANTYAHGARLGYVDVAIQELIDAGVHVVVASGNDYMKIDVPGGVDWDNYYVGGFFNGANPNYYHRGSSPFDDQAIMVGSIDSSVYSASLDQKSVFSNSGPGVDIYAPGSNVRSACSTTNAFASQPYYLNSAFRQLTISGTSMASPQVCGVGALILQAYPGATPNQLKQFMLNNCATDVIYSTGLNNDYTNNRSIKGGANKFLFQKLGNRDDTLKLLGSLVSQNINFRY
jgi:subtilisin family serine protease